MDLYLLQDETEYLADFVRPLALALQWRERWGQVLMWEDVASGWTHICARPLATVRLEVGRISHLRHEERHCEYVELGENPAQQIAEILRQYASASAQGQQPQWLGYATSSALKGLDRLHVQLFSWHLLWQQSTGRTRFVQWGRGEGEATSEEWRQAAAPAHLLTKAAPFHLKTPLQALQGERAWGESVGRLRAYCAANAAYSIGTSRLYASTFEGDFAQIYRVLAGKYKSGGFLLDMLYQQIAAGVGEEGYALPCSAMDTPLPTQMPDLQRLAVGDALLAAQDEREPLEWLLSQLLTQWASVQGVPAAEAARLPNSNAAAAIWALRLSCDARQMNVQRLQSAFFAQDGEQICAASHAFLQANTTTPMHSSLHHRQKTVFDKIAEMAEQR